MGAEVNWGIRFTCESDADTFLDGLAGRALENGFDVLNNTDASGANSARTEMGRERYRRVAQPNGGGRRERAVHHRQDEAPQKQRARADQVPRSWPLRQHEP